MEAIFKTKELYRDFKSGAETIHALKNINIEIKNGALTILRGRSGSGKTTLINLLGAIDRPTKGSVEFDKRDISKLKEIERDNIRKKEMGFVFQSGGLISNMTAYENIDFELRVVGFDYKYREKRVKECLNLVGLSKRGNHFPYELSGGEAQRVAIARAISHKPRIIFADEPTAALDTTMGLQVVKIFKELVDKEGLAVVMTTHDPNMIDIADYVYTLQDGEIVNE